MDARTRKLKIVKLFTLEEGNEFVNEVENNSRLPDESQYLVKMDEFHDYDEDKIPFRFSEEELIYDYAYIVIPFIKGVSLIEYLIHKVDTKSEVSLEDTRCLLYHIVEALHELEALTGLSHMDLKPDNIMITQ
jgi:serine/threonine protein kinase